MFCKPHLKKYCNTVLQFFCSHVICISISIYDDKYNERFSSLTIQYSFKRQYVKRKKQDEVFSVIHSVKQMERVNVKPGVKRRGRVVTSPRGGAAS